MRRNELFYELGTGLGVLVCIQWSAEGRATVGVDITMSSDSLWKFDMEIAPDDRPDGIFGKQYPFIPDDVVPETKRISEQRVSVSLRRTVNCFEVTVRKSGGGIAMFNAGFLPGLKGEMDKLNVVQTGAWSIIMEVDVHEHGPSA